jgi:carboxypeptidase C (cathepsin A)
MNSSHGRRAALLVALALVLTPLPPAGAKEAPADAAVPARLRNETHASTGSFTTGGRAFGYGAEAGILVVHPTDPMDAEPHAPGEKPAPAEPEAGMSYVAYFLGKQPDPARPITFLFNGGPGSSTVWLHMGAFGPKRVVTADAAHTPAAPYRLVDNVASLLPESDLVFIDAPGTGFGHVRGADRNKAFWGVDQDAELFANFIVEFLSRHGRWNSPKYLFGESYGTTRAGVLSYLLQERKSIDLNGVILLSQSLSYDTSPDAPELNPSIDEPYALYLPTYAATAWYHHALPDQPAALEPLLREVEQFALTDYLTALAAGSSLPAERRAAIAARLHAYTGLPADLIERANLRITAGVFEQHLLGMRTTGRLDTRFAGPSIDPLAKESDYDPQSAAISSAFVSVFNDYARRVLGFGADEAFAPGAPVEPLWDFLHRPPGAGAKLMQAVNVMPDLAFAMKANPGLKVQMNGGYFDLATPYFAAEYELTHLPLPPDIAKNIEVRLYPSGHMVYAHEASLVAIHDNVADFIRRTRAAH